MTDSAAPRRDLPERLGDFRLLERLGAGGMGVVYRARDEVLARDVALKVIRPESLHFDEARERFRREVEAAAKLRHPGIVPIYSVGEDAGLPFFAMELVDGRSLADVIEAVKERDPARLSGADLRAALSSPQRSATATAVDSAATPRATRSGADPFAGTWVQACCRLIAQVADALEHAHSNGVLHRDVKPSNVVVTRDGRALLLDFGLASTTESSRITRTGSQAGSLPYMPPERLSGGLAAADATGDVYSLGVTLYELLALRLPFEGDSFEPLLRAIATGDATPLSARNSAVPRDAAIVCATAMEPDPARRYPSAAAFASDLRNMLELRPLEARTPSTALRVRRWMQRNPTAAVALALGFLLLVVAPSIAWWRIRQERDAAVHELAVRREMLTFFLGLLGSGDTDGADAGTRSVQELVDEGSRRIRTALDDQPEVRGPLLAELAKVQNSLGRPREALELAEAALELREVASVPEAELHRLAGSALGQLGEYERSERELALARDAALAAGKLAGLADDLELELAANDFRRHDLDAAAARLEALEADPSSEVHGDTVAAISWLVLRAEIANARGDFAASESAYRRVLDVVTRRHGREHPQFARHLQNLAVALNAQGRHADALPLLVEAREIRTRTLQSEGLEDARLAFNLAAVNSRLERLHAAADEYGRALELCRRLTGDSPQTAKAAAGMGSVLVKAGEFERAEPILREALALSLEYVPRQGWTAAEAPLWLARCLAKRGTHGEAAQRFAEALACLDETAYGRPDLAAKIEGELADEFEALGRDADAALHRERARAWQESE
ncbi:MAG: serine/threonine-protein kinase [Planctomycetes bacterium]|nr:serine/threonine-protein kinase [Planctomycetota bacterium]